MILNIKGSNRRTRKLVDRATWWYAEKLMGKRLMSGLEININLSKTLLNKDGNEGTAIWEDESIRPKEFTIELDLTFSIRDVLITLAHEMVHVKQWAKGEMYEYITPGMVRFHKTKFELYNKGNHFRDFTYIGDVVKILYLLRNLKTKDHNVLNICSNTKENLTNSTA